MGVFGDRLEFQQKLGGRKKYKLDGGNMGLQELLDLVGDHSVRCLACELVFPQVVRSSSSFLHGPN